MDHLRRLQALADLLRDRCQLGGGTLRGRWAPPEEIGRQFPGALIGQQLLAAQVDAQGFEARPVLHRLGGLRREGGTGGLPTGRAANRFAALRDGFQRGGRQVDHLASFAAATPATGRSSISAQYVAGLQESDLAEITRRRAAGEQLVLQVSFLPARTVGAVRLTDGEARHG